VRVIRTALSDCCATLLRGLSEDGCCVQCFIFCSVRGCRVKVIPILDQQISQAEFAAMVGLSEARVSQLVGDGVIVRGDTAQEWLVAYCERLRDQAAGRVGSEVGGLDLVQERAALAREQREGQAIKNAVARKDYAPVGLLADVLGQASSAVVDRFDQLEGALKKACPTLPDEAKTTVLQVIASARNEWIRSTERLVADSIDAMLAADGQEDDDAYSEGMPA
jgi:phage terminase Nu1 subunit (DNA packaging protein)